ncbi:MAG: hypothetical protein ACTSPB_22120 [Candidatus Thorarchaeota archaeon]
MKKTYALHLTKQELWLLKTGLEAEKDVRYSMSTAEEHAEHHAEIDKLNQKIKSLI